MVIGRIMGGSKVHTLKGTEASLSYVQYFLYLASFSINVSIFHVTWLDTSWTDLIYGSWFLIHSATLCLLVVAFKAFTFKVIIDNTCLLPFYFLTIFLWFSFFLIFLFKASPLTFVALLDCINKLL